MFIESRRAEANAMGRKQRLIEISFFVKDDGKNHLVTITGIIAYLNPPTRGWEEADVTQWSGSGASVHD